MTGLIIWVASAVGSAVIARNKKYEVVSFFLFGLFLGPMMLIIALLLPPNKTSSFSSSKKEILNVADASNELSMIKQVLEGAQQRILQLEKRLNILAQQRESGEATILTDPQKSVSQAMTADVVANEKKEEGFEFVFGKYWLNRLGAVIFFLGVVFFISYTFKYLNAFAKIAMGYFASLAFFLCGHFLEKKEKYVKISWGILGVAWGLLYLSTYAMHYIEVTRMIESPIVALWLLAAVSFAAIIYNLKYKSWVVSSLTYLLAFMTIGIGGIDYSTTIYYTFLAASIAYLSFKLEWHKFLLAGIVGTYLTFAVWIHPHIFTQFMISKYQSIPVSQFQLSFIMLLLGWALFIVSHFLTKIDLCEQLQYTVAGVLFNASFFTLLGLNEIYRVKPFLTISWDPRYWFLIVSAGMYFTLAYLYRQNKKPKMMVVDVSIAFSLLAMAFLIKFPKVSVGFFWIAEMAMIFALGVYYKEIVYRALASLLGIAIVLRLVFVDYYSSQFYDVGFDIKHGVLIFTFATFCFYVVGALVEREGIKNRLSQDEKGIYNAYTILATILFVAILGKEAVPKWLTLSWVLQGVIVLSIGFILKNRFYRMCALGVFAFAACRLVFIDMAGVTTVYKIAAFLCLGAVLLGVSLFYAKFMSRLKS